MSARIKELRRARGLTQVELAAQAKIHPISLVRIETGQRAPALRTLRKLAAALGVEIGALVQ